MVSVVNGLVVILFSVQNVKRWVHRRFCEAPKQVSLLLYRDVFV